MEKRIVAQLNHEGFFLYPAEAHGDGMPGGAIEQFPPGKWRDDKFEPEPLPEHNRWHWNGKEYEQAPDYRGQLVYRPDGSTYYPENWGPLPEGDSLEAPPPTPEEIDAEARAFVLGELAALDAEFLTPRTLAGLATGDEYAKERFRRHEEQAEVWRVRLSAIPVAETA